MGATADKIAEAIASHERNGAAELSAYRAARAAIAKARLDEGRLAKLRKDGYDPAHAVLVHAQNFASLVAEKLSELKELRSFARIVGNAEEEYMPGFPPMSPVTVSHFTMWALFDVLFGKSEETIGTCLQRINKDVAFPGPLSDALDVMRESRMGFHVHCGFEGRYVRLREIGGDDIKLCYPSSGFTGAKGEIWFARLVAPSRDQAPYHVVMTTPYVLVGTTESMISAYLARETARIGRKALPHGMDAHTFIMKHGPSPNHWNEYIFCGYVNFRQDAVFISGVPDMKETLPSAS